MKYRDTKRDIWNPIQELPEDIGERWENFFYNQPETQHMKKG